MYRFFLHVFWLAGCFCVPLLLSFPCHLLSLRNPGQFGSVLLNQAFLPLPLFLCVVTSVLNPDCFFCAFVWPQFDLSFAFQFQCFQKPILFQEKVWERNYVFFGSRKSFNLNERKWKDMRGNESNCKEATARYWNEWAWKRRWKQLHCKEINEHEVETKRK